MKVYAIEQANNEVKRAYSALIDRLNCHIKLLAENGKPFTSIIAIKRGLLRLKIGYLEQMEKSEIVLDGRLEQLAVDFMEK